MQAEHEAGNANVKPGIFSYTSVIDAWAKLKDASAAERAEAILWHIQK